MAPRTDSGVKGFATFSVVVAVLYWLFGGAAYSYGMEGFAAYLAGLGLLIVLGTLGLFAGRTSVQRIAAWELRLVVAVHGMGAGLLGFITLMGEVMPRVHEEGPGPGFLLALGVFVAVALLHTVQLRKVSHVGVHQWSHAEADLDVGQHEESIRP